MFKRILIMASVLAVFLAACGAPATPTVSPVDIQNTAISSAFTMVAATQIAIPTATPLPPTETPSPTPLPTFTAVPLIPTLPQAVLPSPTTASSSSGDTCDHILDKSQAGGMKRVRLQNTTNGTVKFGLTLTAPNSFGQCGYLTGFNNVIKKGQRSGVIQIPAGQWYVWAFIEGNDGRDTTAEGGFYLGPSKTDDLLTLMIREDSIRLVGP